MSSPKIIIYYIDNYIKIYLHKKNKKETPKFST